MSSGTTAAPIQPDAPVTNTRMSLREPRGGGNALDERACVKSMSVTDITKHTLDVSGCHQLATDHRTSAILT
jgi:hypothetical protein